MPHSHAALAGPPAAHHKNSQPTVRPFRITWHGKTYEVTNFKDYRKVRENGQTVHIFLASDGQGTFELKFSSAEMEWFLGAEK